MTEGGILIVGAGTGTGITSEIVDMIETVREIMSAHAVVAAHVLGLGNVPGIMIGTGTCFCIGLINLIFLSI